MKVSKINLFQTFEEDEEKNGEDNESNPLMRNNGDRRRRRLSLKRTADRLNNEINKRIKMQRGEGDSVFTVSDPDENYFVL